MRLTQIESQHYEYLVKLAPEQPARAVRRSPSRAKVLPTAGRDGPAGRCRPAGSDTTNRPRRPTRRSATITGHVDVKGKTWGPIYVYVENIKERARRAHRGDRAEGSRVRSQLSRRPEGNARLVSQRRSVPAQRVLAVAGASVRSSAATARARSRAWSGCSIRASSRCCVTCTRRCARTSSSSPTGTTRRWAADGSFHLENVPVGARQVVAWTPDAKPHAESVALTPAGATVNFSLQVEPPPPPLDKTGDAPHDRDKIR